MALGEVVVEEWRLSVRRLDVLEMEMGACLSGREGGSSAEYKCPSEWHHDAAVFRAGIRVAEWWRCFTRQDQVRRCSGRQARCVGMLYTLFEPC